VTNPWNNGWMGIVIIHGIAFIMHLLKYFVLVFLVHSQPWSGTVGIKTACSSLHFKRNVDSLLKVSKFNSSSGGLLLFKLNIFQKFLFKKSL